MGFRSYQVGTKTRNKQIPSHCWKNTLKLGKRQTIHKNPKENGERKEPEEKRVRQIVLHTPRKRPIPLIPKPTAIKVQHDSETL